MAPLEHASESPKISNACGAKAFRKIYYTKGKPLKIESFLPNCNLPDRQTHPPCGPIIEPSIFLFFCRRMRSAIGTNKPRFSIKKRGYKGRAILLLKFSRCILSLAGPLLRAFLAKHFALRASGGPRPSASAGAAPIALGAASAKP